MVVGEVPIDKLSDDQLRIEIAEWCGWKHWNNDEINPDGSSGYWRDPDNRTARLSDYPHDLNAIADAVHSQQPEWRLRFYSNLAKIVGYGCFSIMPQNYALLADATARQRAIAFVKTIREI